MNRYNARFKWFFKEFKYKLQRFSCLLNEMLQSTPSDVINLVKCWCFLAAILDREHMNLQYYWKLLSINSWTHIKQGYRESVTNLSNSSQL